MPISPRSFPEPHPVWLATALLLGAPLAALAQPAASALDYDLPAAPLARTLNAIAQRSGVAVSTPAELVSGRQAAPVRGRFTTSQAFDAALAPTGLQAVRGADGSYVLQRRPMAAPAPVAPPARPPEAERPVDPDRSLPAMIVTADRDAVAGGGSVSTVTREELERFPITSTSDLFTGIPGVTTANARNGASVDINIRGVQGDRVKILVDGTQATSNTSKSYGGDGSHNYVDPDLISSMVVEKGPSSGPYGAGTGGGVVSLGTLTAADLISPEDAAAGKTWGLRLRDGWANNAGAGQGYRSYNGATALDVQTPDRNLSGSIAGAWRLLDGKLELVAVRSNRQQANYHAGTTGLLPYDQGLGPNTYVAGHYAQGAEVLNTSQDTESTLLKARLLLPSDQSLELSYNELDSHYGESRITYFNYLREQHTLSHANKRTARLSYAWKPAGQSLWDLRANLWAVKTAEKHAELDSAYAMLADSGRSESAGLEVWNTSVLDLAALGLNDLTLKYGATGATETSKGFTANDPAGSRWIGSAFAQAQAQLGPSLTLDAGTRYEAYGVSGIAALTNASMVPGQSFDVDLDDSHGRFNHSIGLSYQPGDTVVFFARVSQGWRPPTAKEAVRTYVTNQTLIRPEQTRSLEVGAQAQGRSVWQPGDTWRTRLTVFDNRHDDYLLRAVDTAGYYYFNLDGARFRGLEINADYDAGGFFARYGFNYYDSVQYCGAWEGSGGSGCSSQLRTGVTLGTLLYGMAVPPKRTHTLTAGVRLLERRLVLGLRANFVGDPAMTAVNTSGITQSLGWSTYEVYDLFGSYQVSKPLSVAFGIENLRDRYYLPALSSAALSIPSPGRTAKVTLTYQF